MTDTAQSAFRFLDLPIEIRYMVYGYLVGHEQTHQDHRDWHLFKVFELHLENANPVTALLQPHNWPSRGLLLSSKRIAAEARAAIQHVCTKHGPQRSQRVLNVVLRFKKSPNQLSATYVNWGGFTGAKLDSTVLIINVRFRYDCHDHKPDHTYMKMLKAYCRSCVRSLEVLHAFMLYGPRLRATTRQCHTRVPSRVIVNMTHEADPLVPLLASCNRAIELWDKPFRFLEIVASRYYGSFMEATNGHLPDLSMTYRDQTRQVPWRDPLIQEQ